MIYLSSPLRFPSSICVVVFMMFASLSVKAADLPDDQDYLDAAPADALWDGMYFGVHWGYGDGTTKWDDPSGHYRSNMDVSARSYNDGLLAGLQFGYRKQYDAIVVGVETDVSAGNLIGYAPCGATPGVGGSGDTCGHKTDFMGSLTGTLGYATGRSLFYLKGGGAYSRDRVSVSNYDNVPIPPASKSSDRYGWTVGGGVAYAISPRWSVNAEYDHYDFGKQTYVTGTDVNAGSFSVDRAQEIAKFGLNYRLGDAAGNSTVLPISSNLVGEFGTRVGYSSGRFQYKLYDPFTPSQLNSVLTWHDQAGPAAEVFVHLYHTSGLFLKGTFGGVNIGSNKMYDEDTTETMAPDPYSKTVSSTKNGRDIYGTLDFGYTFLQANNWNLGGFVGYGYYKQRLNAYGCEQIATGPVCVPTGSVNPSALGLVIQKRGIRYASASREASL